MQLLLLLLQPMRMLQRVCLQGEHVGGGHIVHYNPTHKIKQVRIAPPNRGLQ